MHHVLVVSEFKTAVLGVILSLPTQENRLFRTRQLIVFNPTHVFYTSHRKDETLGVTTGSSLCRFGEICGKIEQEKDVTWIKSVEMMKKHTEVE